MKKIIICILILLINVIVYGEEEPVLPLREYLNQAIEAAGNEYYDKAIRLYNEAEKHYPSSYLPNSYKGDLYKNNKLYNSAIDEYQKSLTKNLKSMTIYDDLADCYSNIGQDDKAIEVYKLAFDNIYKSSELYNSLAWTYIKANRIDDCLQLLKEGLELYPDTCDLLVTLGSAYYTADQYDNAKKSYLAAEQFSFHQSRSATFRAIVKYNLASLEHSFGHYQDAYYAAQSANGYCQRSSAHVMLTDLYYNMLDFDKALSEIALAKTLPPNTLYSDFSLARIYIVTNKFDRAQEILTKLLNNNDHKWLSSFSTSVDDYHATIYDLAVELFEAKSRSSYALYDNVFAAFYMKYYYWWKAFVYKIKFANISLKIGQKQVKGGTPNKGLENFFDSYSHFSLLTGKALKVAKILKQEQSQSRPYLEPKYNIIISHLSKSASLFYTAAKNRSVILDNVKNLDPKWEKSLIVDAYTYLVESSSGALKKDFIQKLFLLCPYTVANNGFKLHCRITLPENVMPKERKKIYKALKKLRIIYDEKSPLAINIAVDETNIIATVLNGARIEKTIVKKRLDTNKNFAYVIYDGLFVK